MPRSPPAIRARVILVLRLAFLDLVVTEEIAVIMLLSHPAGQFDSTRFLTANIVFPAISAFYSTSCPCADVGLSESPNLIFFKFRENVCHVIQRVVLKSLEGFNG